MYRDFQPSLTSSTGDAKGCWREKERERKKQLKASVRTAQQPAVVVVSAGPCRPHHVSHGHRDHDAVLRLRGPAHCHTGHLMSQIKDRVRGWTSLQTSRSSWDTPLGSGTSSPSATMTLSSTSSRRLFRYTGSQTLFPYNRCDLANDYRGFIS